MSNLTHKKQDPLVLRKQLIQMRLELNRQKIRHEGLTLLKPMEKLRNYKKSIAQNSNPLLMVIGVSLAGFFIARKRHSIGSFLPALRIVSSLLPLFLTTANTSANQAKSDQPSNTTQ